MGASSRQYWRYVALPILMPSILGAMILLFGNAFGAQATAYQLTGGTLNIVTLLIGAQISGDVLHNPGSGYAMAMGMVVDHGHHDRRSTRSCSGAPSGGSDDGDGQPRLGRRVARRRGAVPAGRRPARLGSWLAWVVFILGAPYFFLPLVGTFCIRSAPSRIFPAYTNVVRRPGVLRRASATRSSSASSRSSSASLLIVPTAYWVRLKRAPPAAGRRVRHAAAVRRPAGRPRLRAHPRSTAARRSR